MTPPIEELVERTKAGDRRAAEALLAAVQDDLFRLAMRMLGLRAEAEDATQEIFAALGARQHSRVDRLRAVPGVRCVRGGVGLRVGCHAAA